MAISREQALNILGLQEGATEQEIKDRYTKLALNWHPAQDKQAEKDNSVVTEKFQELSAAYKKLTTDEEITKDELMSLFQQMFNCQVSVCRLDGGNIIFMNSSMANGENESNSDSDSDNGTPVHSVSTDQGNCNMEDHNSEDETTAAKVAAELIKEEEEKTQKAERRRAKNKKKKEAKKRKKLHNNSSSNGTGPAPTAASQHEKKSTSSIPQHQKQKASTSSTAVAVTLEEKVNNNTMGVESDGDFDSDEKLSNASDDEDAVMKSAFFAHAAQGAISKLGNEGKVLSGSSGGDKNGDHSTDECDPAIKRSRDIAKEGNILATNGEFKKAIEKFTEAINLYPGDQRYYGNRSFCYDLLGDYDNALIDAAEAVRLAPGWAKGYLRKGRALYGLKQYDEAEKAYQDVLKYDSNNEDATKELYKCHTLQLMSMGFSVEESEAAARKHNVMAHAIDDLLAGKVETLPAGGPRSAGFTPPKGTSSSSKRHASDSIFDSPKIKVEDGFAVRSLWVGNVNPERVSESQVAELFGKYGRVVSVRILIEKHCAFVNFERPQAAADALNGLQGYYLGGGYLLIRYPDNPKASLIHSRAERQAEEQEQLEKDNANFGDFTKKTGPVNGDECYFWRTTGCHFGRKCHYKHIPQHRGIDRTATMVPKPRS